MDRLNRPVVIHPDGDLSLMTKEMDKDGPKSDECFKYFLSIFGFQECFYRHKYTRHSQEVDFDLISFFMVTD